MFVNCTNHPSNAWSSSQREAAAPYGEIVDFPFPEIDPMLSEAELDALAHRIAGKILELKPDAVLCQGEMGMTYLLVPRLLAAGIPVYHACSRRRAQEKQCSDGSTTKNQVFTFERFRRYGAPAEAINE